MVMLLATSARASQAYQLVTALQARWVDVLEGFSRSRGHEPALTRVDWLRDKGRHGGGRRWMAGDDEVFNRASVNVSQVQYDDEPERKLGSATALSTIIHPHNPHAPSVHMHVSWTELRDQTGYWRMMADLNPALPLAGLETRFESRLRSAAPAQYDQARAQGERYFYIPALGRHRGVSHFYLEQYHTDDFAADLAMAQRVGESTIDVYGEIVRQAAAAHPEVSAEAWLEQLRYHTLYAFQVLTLDRGTTSGLLVHDQNDEGILGSLPSHIDRDLLQSWRDRVPPIQRELVDGILGALPPTAPCRIDDEVKRSLAAVLRHFYAEHPEALALQATGDVVPPTVRNHH